MELNFDKLEALAFIDLTTAPEAEKQAQKAGQAVEDSKQATTKKERLQGKIEGLGKLQREIDQSQREKEQAREVYATHQQNIRLTEQLQTEILKGVKAGESVYNLFLKASKAISLMTGNPLFIEQIEADIKAIYGEGLTEPEPLKLELEETEQRLLKLKKSAKRDTIEADSKERIQNAIKAHEARITELKELVIKGV